MLTKRVLTILALSLMLLPPAYPTNRCYDKLCRRCNLRSGECHTCSGSAYFTDVATDPTTNYPLASTTRTDPKCYIYTSLSASVTEGCLEWTYDIVGKIESCFRCREDYWRSTNGLKCTKNNGKKACSANCKSCYEKAGVTIDQDGNNSVCTVCKRGFGQHITA
jgi:hypothetical protein